MVQMPQVDERQREVQALHLFHGDLGHAVIALGCVHLPAEVGDVQAPRIREIAQLLPVVERAGLQAALVGGIDQARHRSHERVEGIRVDAMPGDAHSAQHRLVAGQRD